MAKLEIEIPEELLAVLEEYRKSSALETVEEAVSHLLSSVNLPPPPATEPEPVVPQEVVAFHILDEAGDIVHEHTVLR